MPVLFSYLLKLSVSLAVVFLFYQLVLRKLTFYNWNRWYLFIYTTACFFIPFIDISPVLHRNQWTDITIVQWIPAINESSKTNNTDSAFFNYWNLTVILLISGIAFMFCRLLVQLISFRKMMRKAELISGEELKVYQVNDPIIPFSFGNSVFINRNLHTAEELEEIIHHEFVHVKQKHSFDIIWGELLCLMNWYNPFAWLLRKSIRQNLEFIADKKVIENGIDKKEYQYLLLKVIGNNQFSIAAQFNFSSLKKRIAMMNKTKSAKRQLLRLLFLLPATAILLLAFRNKMAAFNYEESEFQTTDDNYQSAKPSNTATRDTVPKKTKPAQSAQIPQKVQPAQIQKPAQPAQAPKPVKISKSLTTAEFNVNDDKVTVKLKDGTIESYNLKDSAEKRQYEEKYNTPVLTQNIYSTTNVNLDTKITPTLATTLKNNVVIANNNLNTTNISNNVVNAKIATTVKATAVTNIKSPEVTIINSPNLIGTTVTGSVNTTISDADILVTITKNTKPEELESLISKLKEKGYELKITNKNYNDGILTKIKGTVKYKNNNSNFSATDFNTITIASYRDDDNVRFKIFVDIKKQVKKSVTL